jgi:hypothetical protein
MSIRRVWQPSSIGDLELHNVLAEPATFRGRRAVRLTERVMGEGGIAVLPDSELRDGRIATRLAGLVRPDAAPDMRGFVGVAFHVQPGGQAYECVFVRPTNARADEQLRRNHSTQYISHPDHPWYRLREEAPGVYESYTDLVPGAWTRFRLELEGVRARLSVGAAGQPCLVVNDLKMGEASGRVAMWIGAGTEAYFAEVYIASAQP